MSIARPLSLAFTFCHWSVATVTCIALSHESCEPSCFPLSKIAISAHATPQKSYLCYARTVEANVRVKRYVCKTRTGRASTSDESRARPEVLANKRLTVFDMSQVWCMVHLP